MIPSSKAGRWLADQLDDAKVENKRLRTINAELVGALQKIMDGKSVVPHAEIARIAIAKANIYGSR